MSHRSSTPRSWRRLARTALLCCAVSACYTHHVLTGPELTARLPADEARVKLRSGTTLDVRDASVESGNLLAMDVRDESRISIPLDTVESVEVGEFYPIGTIALLGSMGVLIGGWLLVHHTAPPPPIYF